MTTLERRILGLGVLLAPIPTGYVVSIALLKQQWPIVVVLVTALALEILGYFSVRLVMAVREHNRTLSAAERAYSVPERRVWLPVGFYVTVALTLTFLLEIAPGAYLWALLAFPFVGVLMAWIYSEFGVLENMAQSKVAARLAAKEARAQARLEKKQPVEQPKQPEPTAQTTQERNKINRAALVAQLRLTPGATNAQLATPFGASAEGVRKVRKTITPAELGLANESLP